MPGFKMPRVQLLDTLERIGELPPEIWFVPPILILAGMAAIGWLGRGRMLRRYHAIAERTGLAVVPKFFNPSEVRGSFRGRDLVMTSTGRRRQTIRKLWTLVTVDVANPESISLQMWQQGAIDRLVLALGGTEVVVGDPDFDRRFVIQSLEPELVAKMFRDAELRHLLIDAGIDRVELRQRLFAYYARNERDPEHAAILFTAVTRLADAIDSLRVVHKPEIIRTS